MQWINTHGGPFVILEKSHAPQWSGSFKESDRDISDYEKTLVVHDYIQVININNKKVIVLDDEPMQTTIIKSPKKNLFIIRWEWAENEVSVLNALQNIDSINFDNSLYVEFENTEEKLYLFDAAISFKEVAEKIELELSPGHHRIYTTKHQPDLKTSLLLHKIATGKTENGDKYD